MKHLYPLLGMRPLLWLLLIINILGTLYGYYWYRHQLADTPGKYLIFVPDSPTASLFFVFVLIAFLLRKNWPLFEALAVVTLFKYGVWAVVMNLLVYALSGALDWSGIMLIVSHAAMAVQGILYAPFCRLKHWHLLAAALWTLHNDVIDYLFQMMPRYHMLHEYMPSIGYFTFWLSIFSIGLAYYLTLRKNRFVCVIP